VQYDIRRDPAEHRWLGVHEVRAVEHQHVEVNIEVERRPKLTAVR
jgi:hypothetical protein